MKIDHPPARAQHRAEASFGRRLRARIASWWQRRVAARERRIQLEALTLLSQRLLQDIGVRDSVRAHGEAIRDARYDRMAHWIAR